MDEQREILRQRPDIEQITTRYEQLQADIRNQLSAHIDGLAWIRYNDGSRSGCGFEFPDIHEGESRSLPGWSAKGGIPDGRWDEALAIVREITGKHGFGTPETIVNRPNDHFLVIRDPYGGSLDFGTAVNATLQVHTACHLPPTRD